MRLSFTICVISLVSLVLGIPIPAFKPGDIVHMPHSAVTNNLKKTAPNMKYDTTKTKRPNWDPAGSHPAVVVAGPHADGTYDLAHMSHNLPKDAYPHRENIFSKYHPGLDGQVNMGPKTVNAHGSQLAAHSAGPMHPDSFKDFQIDRAKHQPAPPSPPPAPAPAPAPKDQADAGTKRQRTPTPPPEPKKQKTN